MNSWKYCGECGNGMERPSLADAVSGTQECPTCGNERELDHFEKNAVASSFENDLESLMARVERLEARNK